MKKFILFAGLLGLFAGFGSLFPSFAQQIMPAEQPGMLLTIFGLTAMFLGVLMIIGSRDLEHRGVFVAWVGIFKVIAFGVMAYHGIFGDGGMKLVMGGTLDLIIGIVVLVGLPRQIGVSLINIILDR